VIADNHTLSFDSPPLLDDPLQNHEMEKQELENIISDYDHLTDRYVEVSTPSPLNMIETPTVYSCLNGNLALAMTPAASSQLAPFVDSSAKSDPVTPSFSRFFKKRPTDLVMADKTTLSFDLPPLTEKGEEEAGNIFEIDDVTNRDADIKPLSPLGITPGVSLSALPLIDSTYVERNIFHEELTSTPSRSIKMENIETNYSCFQELADCS